MGQASLSPPDSLLPASRTLFRPLVAALSSFVTLFLYSYLAAPPQSKLAELSDLIAQRYVEEPDMVALEGAAASAMVDATADRWS